VVPSTGSTRLRRTTALAVIPTVAALLLAGCGSPTSSASKSDDTKKKNVCDTSKVAALATELKDVTGQARIDALTQKVEAEGGEVTLYGELNVDQAQPLIEAFEDTYDGITVNLYRAGTDQIRQRVLEEASANRGEADLVELDATEMAQLDAEHLLIPASSPWAADVSPAGQFENYTADRFSYISPMWNTKKLPAADIPQSLEDLTDPKYKGKIALEGSDVFWFAGLVQYLTKEQGMTKDDAVDLFKRIAANASITDGHTTTSELVVSGEFELAVNAFAHRTIAFMKEGAPVDWQPVNVPVVAETTTVAIPCAAKHPAAALLLQDFFLDPAGAQKLFLDLDRTPANVAVAATQLTGDAVEPIQVDVREISRNFAEWQDLWDTVIQAGQR
jgi:iron(III) transport system substrate-binding protein